ncbi:MAG: DEAD/DEAH box helicase, partial [Gammaproteobacteria bacterium]|nr:DEAD/DEAH box helicase [Gammaproteobacteria bacterium]
DRFADWPINIAMLSRFNSSKEQKEILEKLTNGQVDIVIGTHKLIQKDIKFKNLGLLIIDEEHRFGVKQKEKIKSLRAHIDILALTATPIPRTLSMALANISDLSIIASPPERRLAIKTFIKERNNQLLREAVLREIWRGGQIYFLHNDIATITAIAHELSELIPEAKVNIAHGQMRERQLEHIMNDFYHMRFNLLVCTTIIESGIDIPTANTIIINRADKFGLAQLHQLRGRVGRSHHQAYAYLIVPSHDSLTRDAKKRLEAIEYMEDLGAGFMLATHDLEIRGAGEILGEEQSGQIQTIGYNLYMELLEKAVKTLQSGGELDLDETEQPGTEIDLAIPALLPDTYVPNVNTRLTIYKRISNAKKSSQLHDLKIEFIDRFGLLPDATKNLFAVTELKLQAEKLGIKTIKVGPAQGHIEFQDKPNVTPERVISLIRKHPITYQFASATKLRFKIHDNTPSKKIQAVREILNHFST